MNYNIQNGENLALKMGNNNPDSKSDRELNIGKMVVNIREIIKTEKK